VPCRQLPSAWPQASSTTARRQPVNKRRGALTTTIAKPAQIGPKSRESRAAFAAAALDGPRPVRCLIAGLNCPVAGCVFEHPTLNSCRNSGQFVWNVHPLSDGSAVARQELRAVLKRKKSLLQTAAGMGKQKVRWDKPTEAARTLNRQTWGRRLQIHRQFLKILGKRNSPCCRFSNADLV
jgi:hypothetical protein